MTPTTIRSGVVNSGPITLSVNRLNFHGEGVGTVQ